MSLAVALQSFFMGLAASLQLLAAWSENCRRKTGITQKVYFFSETATVQPPLGQQEAAVDDSGDDKGK